MVFAPLQLMIIRNMYVVRVGISPGEAYSELIVDPDAVPAFPVAFQFLEPVRRWDLQIAQFPGTMDHEKFPQSDSLYRNRELFRKQLVPDLFRFRALE